jgi:hypothetical protein
MYQLLQKKPKKDDININFLRKKPKKDDININFFTKKTENNLKIITTP